MAREKRPEPGSEANKRAADSNFRFMEAVLKSALHDKPELRDQIINDARQRVAGALAEGKTFEPVRLRNGSEPATRMDVRRGYTPESDAAFFKAVMSKVVVDDKQASPPAEHRRIDKER